MITAIYENKKHDLIPLFDPYGKRPLTQGTPRDSHFPKFLVIYQYSSRNNVTRIRIISINIFTN